MARFGMAFLVFYFVYAKKKMRLGIVFPSFFTFAVLLSGTLFTFVVAFVGPLLEFFAQGNSCWKKNFWIWQTRLFSRFGDQKYTRRRKGRPKWEKKTKKGQEQNEQGIFTPFSISPWARPLLSSGTKKTCDFGMEQDELSLGIWNFNVDKDIGTLNKLI